MWKCRPLNDSTLPGDKGVGLVELAAAGLRIPPTAVLERDGDAGTVDVDLVFRTLDVAPDTTVLLRPSLLIDRHYAPAVSGLFPSLTADSTTMGGRIEEIGRSYQGADRRQELAMTTDNASVGFSVLVQPYVEPSFSGITHVRADDGPLRVEVGLVEGHLSTLVDGQTPGWQCELSAVEVDAETDVALIADEGDLEEILADPARPGLLVSLYRDMAGFGAHAPAPHEIEWAATDAGIVYLQAQPLTA